MIGGARGVIFDLEGTLFRSGRAIPGAAETVARLRREGIALRFLTNATSLSRRGLTDKLARLGFVVEQEEVRTGATAAAEFVRRHGGSAWLLVPAAAHEDFEGVPLNEHAPDWIVLGDLGPEWTFETLNRAFVAIHRHGSRLLALVRSRYWMAEGGLQLDAGPFVVALEYAAATTAITFGKPEAEAFLGAVRSMGLPAHEVLMVGDDPETDVAAALRAGLRAALVLTGKVDAIAAARAGLPPEVPVLSSAADLRLAD